MPGRYALIIGNSRYRDKTLGRISSPAADVRTLEAILKDPELGEFDQVDILLNKEAVVAQRKIVEFFSGKKIDDLLLLYFSGHGVLDEHGRLYFAFPDTELNLLRGTAISSSFITDEMDNCRSKRQVLILDSCHSGAFMRGTKGMLNRPVDTAEAFKGSGYGRVIMTASDATQYAFEGEEILGKSENSLFTHYLIEGIQSGAADYDQDGYISVTEIFDYICEHVSETSASQTPLKWAFKERGNIYLAKSPFKAKKIVTATLPVELLTAIESPLANIRQAAVLELKGLLENSNPELVNLAREQLRKLSQDDSHTISQEVQKAHGAAEPGAPPGLPEIGKTSPALSEGVEKVIKRAAVGTTVELPPTLPEPVKASFPRTERKLHIPTWIWVGACLVVLFLLLGLLGGGIWSFSNWKIHSAQQNPQSSPSVNTSAGSTITGTPALPGIGVPSGGTASPTSFSSSGTLENSPHPVISLGRNGQICLAWAGKMTGEWRIYYAGSDDGGYTFTAPLPVDGTASQAQQHPSLVVDANGRFHLAWEDMRNGNWDIYYTHSDDGITFTSSVRINDDNTQQDQIHPSVAGGSNGSLQIVWQDGRSGDWDIYSSSSIDRGETFTANKRVNTETRGQQITPLVAIDGQGEVHVVWADNQSGSYYVYYSRTDGAGFDRGRLIGTGLMADLSGELPSLLVDKVDKIHVAWANAYILHNVYQVPLYLPVYASSTDGGKTFSTPRQAGNGYQYVSVRPNETTIADDGLSVHVILTTYSPRDGSLIWDYRSLDGGANFEDPVSIAQSKGGDVMHYPVAIVDLDGHIHVLWACARGDEWDIYYSQSIDGGKSFSSGIKVSAGN